MLKDGTDHAEHIQITITSKQEADNVILNLDRSLITIRVGVIKADGNIGIYCSCVFHVWYGPNQ